MCYKLEELQEIIDGNYKGDRDKALEHIKICPKCREKFQKLKQQEKLIESILQIDMKVPHPRCINTYTVDFQKKNKGRIFAMSKKARKWSMVAAGLVLCGGLVLNKPMRTKAEDFLKIFRMQKMTSISINRQDISEIGRIFSNGTGSKNISDIIKIDVASKEKNISIEKPYKEEEIKQKLSLDKVVKAPKGFSYDCVSKNPKIDATLELNVDKVNDLLTYLGENTKLPKSLDKNPFNIHLKDSIAYDFSKTSKGVDDEKEYIQLIKTSTPTIEVPKNVDEKEIIKSLFSMNILPDNLKNQFIQINDLTSTIPIPYIEETQTKEEVNIKGEKAIVIKNKKDRYMTVYLQEDNNLYIVSSNCSSKEVLEFMEEI